MSDERAAINLGEVYGAIELVRPELSTKSKRPLQRNLSWVMCTDSVALSRLQPLCPTSFRRIPAS